MLDKAQFKLGKVVFEHYFRRVCSKKSKGFSLNPRFTLGGWHEVKCVY